MDRTQGLPHLVILFVSVVLPGAAAWCVGANFFRAHVSRRTSTWALSDDFLENDLVAVQPPEASKPRLCVVRSDGSVSPLCTHEDDVVTDLFSDPRSNIPLWSELTDEDVIGTYGEGWYGQRPVPSLGGGPGYGAEADEIWSVDEEVLEAVEKDGVEIPLLDVGISHGEKARGGAF